jgi:flagellin
MGSILTNTSVMTALQALSGTRRKPKPASSKPAERSSRGAEDDAAYWSITAAIRSITAAVRADSGALGRAKDPLSPRSSPLGAACIALNKVFDATHQMKQLLDKAAQQGADRREIQANIAVLQDQLRRMADSASAAGQNLLATDSSVTGYNATKSIVASYTSDLSGALSMSTVDIDQGKIKLFDATTMSTKKGILDRVDAGTGLSIIDLDISTLTDSQTDRGRLSRLAAQLVAAIHSICDASAALGAIQARVTAQSRPICDLGPSNPNAAGGFVRNEPEMAAPDTLSAPQPRSSYLSVANQNSELILKMFGG